MDKLSGFKVRSFLGGFFLLTLFEGTGFAATP
jgi:hypothetical protein